MREIIAERKAQIEVLHDQTTKATNDLKDATELLLKDRIVIARLENHSTIVKHIAAEECKQELLKVQQDSGQRLTALKAALGQARRAQNEMSSQNQKLMQQVEALKQQIAQAP